MSSSETTAAVRKWHFTLHLKDVLTEEQSDTLAGLDRFNDGRIGLVEGPDTAEFMCSFEAGTLTGAIAEALDFFEELPGVLIRSVELDPLALESNRMATASVAPAPPRLPETV
ncbi:hypothetical protein [Streptomyces katsurahamanus]|uniref:hypothetical protein n=1 Tax=Streptomyces katsurahamanus TaxID=2577098 RepID=UPI0012966B58|nr:hypothetical protein [Streptomyces katsurahamanus]